MAVTLLELSTALGAGGTFQDRISAACVKAAVAIKFEDPGTANHANRLIWASQALADPNSVRVKVQNYVLAALIASDGNLTLADLTNPAVVDDTDIQDNVNASVDIFA